MQQISQIQYMRHMQQETHCFGCDGEFGGNLGNVYYDIFLMMVDHIFQRSLTFATCTILIKIPEK